MSSSFESLPAEILANIFAYHTDDRKQIGSCRLVSKAFKVASSPFFITKLVFAKRLREVAKAMELAAHPYFSRFVTEIVYDLSYWNHLGSEEYFEKCCESEELGLRHFLDAEWYRSTSAEDRFYSFLCSKTTCELQKAATNFLGQTTDRSHKHGLDPHDDRALRLISEERASRAPNPNRMGCPQSFPQYQRHEFFNDNLKKYHRYLNIFFAIVIYLPNLRAIRFTDHRGLAREIESYSELSTLLFGNVLQPELWNWHLSGNACCTTEAIAALDSISRATERLESVSFGPHGYEMFHHSDEPLVTFKEPHYLCIKSDELLHKNSGIIPKLDRCFNNWKHIFGRLRCARLPFLIRDPAQSLNVAKAMMEALPDTIRSLAIPVRGPVEACLTQKCMTSQMIQPFDEIVSP